MTIDQYCQRRMHVELEQFLTCTQAAVVLYFVFLRTLVSHFFSQRTQFNLCISEWHFYPRDAMLARVIEIGTCLSVRHAPVLCQNKES